jgi:hypothetical protein
MSVRLYSTLYFSYLVPPLLTAPANRKYNGRGTFYNKFALDPRYFRILSDTFVAILPYEYQNNGSLHLAQARYLV